ncbi:thioredoxin family protein [Sulfurirhabdus autotrophica]|uniref:Thioredoxin n=1 Tax=Sulfurirhabdus autotrophica TaxID=1706046 RepID=A0A4R3Y9M7_9PROT|nr:thioredoxin family protein [Sulfurirhabdus autotrophica]TCV89075.1 thioredoxin [Sulfurirhabdus autotrophica]
MLQFQTLTEFDFHQTLEQTEGVSIVMFSGPDCGACRQIEKLLPGVATGIVAQLFKVDAQQCMGLVRQYEVFHFPALFLFVNGYFHATLHSEVTPVKMQAAIDAALARPAEEEP